VEWRHTVYGHHTIAIMWVQHDIMRRVKWRRFLVLFKKCPYDHWLANKAYLSSITVTYISTYIHNIHDIHNLQNGGKNQLAHIWNKLRHRCKKRFFMFFLNFGHVFYVFQCFFYFPNVFYLKNVGKVQSCKQINKKHFQNNSNEIDLWDHE